MDSYEKAIIALKLRRLGERNAIQKALEEAYELVTELEDLLLCYDGKCQIERVVCNVAREYADVTVAVGDTLRQLWPSFDGEVAKKRREVYEQKLPGYLVDDRLREIL